MRADWSRPLAVERESERNSRFDFELKPASLARIAPELAADEGWVRGHAEFGRDYGLSLVSIELQAELPLVCQRCLRTVRWPVSASSQLAVIGSDREERKVPGGLDSLLAPGMQVSISELVEEELLLALPIVARHENEDCHAGPPQDGPAQAVRMRRPFAELGELLKRDG
ncbi:MAG: YceD family protein [Steroidobacteraceae bacterium]